MIYETIYNKINKQKNNSGNKTKKEKMLIKAIEHEFVLILTQWSAMLLKYYFSYILKIENIEETKEKNIEIKIKKYY